MRLRLVVVGIELEADGANAVLSSSFAETKTWQWPHLQQFVASASSTDGQRCWPCCFASFRSLTGIARVSSMLRQWPTPEPAPLSQLWRLQPARPQPPPNPLLRSSGLDLAGIKMASLFCPNARAMLMFSVSFQIYRLAGNKNSKSLCPHTWRLPSKIKPRTGDFCSSTRNRRKNIRFTVARADMQNQGRTQHHKPWFIAANFQKGKSITRQKSSQVSPNTRWLAQCKGGGGKNICMYIPMTVQPAGIFQNLAAAFAWNRNVGKSEAEHPLGPHFSQQLANCHCRKRRTCRTFSVLCPKLASLQSTGLYTETSTKIYNV